MRVNVIRPPKRRSRQNLVKQ